MDELFDIVDDRDEVVGRATRKEVHTKGQIHRSVLFFVFDGEGRVFVNQRTKRKEFYPGCWSVVFGGHVHAGESYAEAVAREAKEEAGIEGRPAFIAGFRKRFDDKDRENVQVYGLVADKELTIDAEEISQGAFMTLEELEQKLRAEKFLPETPGLVEILKSLRNA